MRLRVRPVVTSNTRRKQLCIKMQVPKRVFDDLMASLSGRGVAGLEIGLTNSLRPTSSTSRVHRYEYILNKGSSSDAFFRLEELDIPPKESIRKKAAGRCFKRGLGCARLHLSGAAGRRGERAQTLAMVCGAVIINYREPLALRAMGTLTIKMFVLSMDYTGHIIWPIKFSQKAMAALRLQARSLLGRMLKDPLYLVNQKMEAALDPNVVLASYLDHQNLAQQAPAAASAREEAQED